MSKIRIDLESISVESFATEEAEGARGTVRGHDETEACTTLACSNFACSANDAQTCARRRTDYASCAVVCECTIAGQKCLPPP